MMMMMLVINSKIQVITLNIEYVEIWIEKYDHEARPSPLVCSQIEVLRRIIDIGDKVLTNKSFWFWRQACPLVGLYWWQRFKMLCRHW